MASCIFWVQLYKHIQDKISHLECHLDKLNCLTVTDQQPSNIAKPIAITDIIHCAYRTSLIINKITPEETTITAEFEGTYDSVRSFFQALDTYKTSSLYSSIVIQPKREGWFEVLLAIEI